MNTIILQILKKMYCSVFSNVSSGWIKKTEVKILCITDN